MRRRVATHSALPAPSWAALLSGGDSQQANSPVRMAAVLIKEVYILPGRAGTDANFPVWTAPDNRDTPSLHGASPGV